MEQKQKLYDEIIRKGYSRQVAEELLQILSEWDEVTKPKKPSPANAEQQQPHIRKDDIEAEWEKLWKDIVTNPDGSINIEQLKKELYEFSYVMEQVPKVYCHITGDKLSKIMYPAETVIVVADDYANEIVEREIADRQEGHITNAQQEGPWKVVTHHEAGVPESGCSGDNYVTITDGKVELYFDGGIDDDDEQRLCNLLNQLKIKLDYDHVAEFVASEMEKMYKDACDEIRRLKEQEGLRWVKASEIQTQDWHICRLIGTEKRFPVFFSAHVACDVSGKTYLKTDIECLSESTTTPVKEEFAGSVFNQVKEAAPQFKLTIEQLSTRERKFFDLLKYILLDEALALGYCGFFEEAVKETGQSTKEGEIAFAEWAGWDWQRVEGKNMWENQKTLEVMKSEKLYETYLKATSEENDGG